MTTCSHVYMTTGDSAFSCNVDAKVPDGGGSPLCYDHERTASARGYVYVAEWGEYVKIGYSASPEARVASLCRGTEGTIPPPDPQPGRPVLIGYAPGDLQTEAMLHAVLDDARVCGEWFRRSPAVELLCQRTLGVGEKPTARGPRSRQPAPTDF